MVSVLPALLWWRLGRGWLPPHRMMSSVLRAQWNVIGYNFSRSLVFLKDLGSAACTQARLNFSLDRVFDVFIFATVNWIHRQQKLLLRDSTLPTFSFHTKNSEEGWNLPLKLYRERSQVRLGAQKEPGPSSRGCLLCGRGMPGTCSGGSRNLYNWLFSLHTDHIY